MTLSRNTNKLKHTQKPPQRAIWKRARILMTGEDSSEEKDGQVVSVHPPCVERGTYVEIESSFDNQSEQMKVDQFLAQSCGCKLGPQGAACSNIVSKESIMQSRNNCLQMTGHELDLVILAQINLQRTHTVDRSCTHHGQGDFRPGMKFFHGIQICQSMFLFLHAIAKTHFRNLCASVSKHGLQDRVHGNARKMPHYASSYSSIEHISKFIANTADTWPTSAGSSP